MKDILRYLGVKTPDERTIRLIDEEKKSAENIIPSDTYACFDALYAENGVFLQGTNVLLSGNLAKKHFAGCRKIIVLLATLGLKSEWALKRAFALNAANAVVLDAVFTDKLEKYLDEREKELAGEFGVLTTRISCGYGDLPISVQKDLFDLIDGGRLGVRMNECYMLTPNKSVIAIIGVQ